MSSSRVPPKRDEPNIYIVESEIEEEEEVSTQDEGFSERDELNNIIGENVSEIEAESTGHFVVDNAEGLREWSDVWLDRLILEAEIGSTYEAEHWQGENLKPTRRRPPT
jgi:hypothetical protein